MTKIINKVPKLKERKKKSRRNTTKNLLLEQNHPIKSQNSKLAIKHQPLKMFAKKVRIRSQETQINSVKSKLSIMMSTNKQ